MNNSCYIIIQVYSENLKLKHRAGYVIFPSVMLKD